MTSCSRLLLGFLNVVALTFSFFQIIYALMSDHNSVNKQCYKNSSRTILMISVFLFMMSLIGLVAACYKSSRALQIIYLCVVVISTFVAVIVTVFIFAALPKASANAAWKKSQNGNWLKEFSPLLRKALVNDREWFVIRTCLVDIDLCEGFRNHSSSSHPAWKENLHYLELGCCIPPKHSHFLQKNGTYWEIPKSGIFSSNSRNGECYDCDSCKAGFLAKFQSDWRANMGIYVGVIVVLFLATSLSSYSFRTERLDHGTKEYDRNV